MSQRNLNKTHWKKYFNYDYLGTYSLDQGKDLILTIKEVKKEVVTGSGGKEGECMVCYFQEGGKPMILNRTNCKIIERVYKTAYVEEWTGKRIQIYAQQGIKAFGSVTDGLRIREYEPQVQTGDAAHKKALKAKVRAALSKYKGNDIEEIKQMLNEKVKANEDTVEFYNNQLEHLTAA